MKFIKEAENAPKAVGPYSLAADLGELVFLSGQIALDPQTGVIKAEGISEQTEQVLRNIEAVLKKLELGFKDIVKTTIFLTDMANFSVVNEIYSRTLNGSEPARSTVAVLALPKEALIEIEVIAKRAS
jgi:2-iminobutanoate/2-iminopropanoate deaminase